MFRIHLEDHDHKPELRREVVYAIKSDDVERVKEIFRKNGNSLPRYDNEDLCGYGSPSYVCWTHCAAEHNAVKVLDWMITVCGFSGLETDYECSYPAHYAARYDAVEALYWLLEHVPDSSYYNDQGEYPRELLSSDGRKRFYELETCDDNDDFDDYDDSDCEEEEEEGREKRQGGDDDSSAKTR